MRLRRKQGETIRRHVALSVAAALIASLLAAGSAQATTFSKQGLTATATTTVKPKRLPAKGTAPVTMDFNIRTRRTTPGTPNNLTLRTVAVRTDKQITVDTEGLPSCSIEQIALASPAQARKVCGSALIGSGTAALTNQFPEETEELRWSMLVFNTTERGKPELLIFTIPRDGPDPVGAAGIIGDIRSFTFSVFEYDWAVTNTIQLKIGARWKHRGKWHSYLNGTCATGAIKNKVTMAMSNGSMSGATPQRCTK